MKIMEQILLLARYNLWADQLICERINQLENDQLTKEIKSSFPTVLKTLGHMFDAERIWLNRLNGRSLDHWPSSKINNFNTEHLLEESRQALQYVESLDEQALNTLCTYSNRSGKEFESKRVEILLHLFNHATYHRGQLITMLRELGESDLPATDIIAFLRTN